MPPHELFSFVRFGDQVAGSGEWRTGVVSFLVDSFGDARAAPSLACLVTLLADHMKLGERLEIPRPPGCSLHPYERFEIQTAAPESVHLDLEGMGEERFS